MDSSFGKSVKGLKTGLKRSPKWMKISWSILAGLALSAICNDWDCFIDTMVLVTCYTAWLSISVPSLYRKLTFKFVCDAIYVMAHLFVADVAVFVVHKTLRRYVSGDDPEYDSQYHRGFMFSMNTVRIGAIIYCIGRSIPAFMKYMYGRTKHGHGKRKRR